MKAKWAYCIVTMLILSFQLSSQTIHGTVFLFSTKTRHKEYEWLVPEERLKKAPRWTPPEGKLPLSVEEAYKKAVGWFSKSGYAGAKILRLQLRFLNTKEASLTGSVFYIVDAHLEPFDSMACVVLLDGTVVEPIEKKRSPK